MAADSNPRLETPLVPAGSQRLTIVAESKDVPGHRARCRRVVTLIGSRVGCKFRLDHPKVLGTHTAIVHTGSSIVAVDLLSSLGTTLNDLKLQHEELSDGDRLSIAAWSFGVEIKEPKAGSGEGVVDLDPAPEVIALEHLDSGRILKPSRTVCTLGRRSGCDIVVDDPCVSRVHALIFQFNGRPAVFDLVSENGTKVNNEPVVFSELANNDVITVGRTQFRMRLVASSIAEKAKTNGQASKPVEEIVLEDTNHSPIDLVDIQATEGSQRWSIVDHLEKATQKKK